LGSAEFTEREAASKELLTIGEPALKVLRRAAVTSGDAEIRRRGESLVTRIEQSIYRQNVLFGEHIEPTWSVAFSPDGRRLLSGGEGGVVRLWDVVTKKVRRFSWHSPNAVISLAISPDGRRALSTSPTDDTFRLWDIDTGEELRRFEGHTCDGVFRAIFSKDGRRALSCGTDRTVRLWDVATGKELRRFTGHTGIVEGVALSPDGRWALSASWDQTARLWEVETGKELHRVKFENMIVTSVAFSPDGSQALVGVGQCVRPVDGGESTLQIWDLDSSNKLRRAHGDAGGVISVAYSSDGRLALSGGGDGTMRLWEVDTGKELHRFERHTGPVFSVAFSPDGQWALSGSVGGLLNADSERFEERELWPKLSVPKSH
jgi:WD40 repeat protein